MKALILNSGMGSRMENLDKCKCLLELERDTTIFDAQIISLTNCGITEIVVTTGAYAEKIINHAKRKYPNLIFRFVYNPEYKTTNYIYSIFLAKQYILDSDIILMHGDLVFEQNILHEIICAEKSSMVIDSTKALPKKDFKSLVENGRIKFIGVDISSEKPENLFYSQPMYKFLSKDFKIWLDEIEVFCKNENKKVYAENAFNVIWDKIELVPVDVSGRLCFEVDNREDMKYAESVFKLMSDRKQKVFFCWNSSNIINTLLTEAKKPFIVSGIGQEALKISGAVYFSDFTPNPIFSDIQKGVSAFEKENCDMIISIGGGSAIDVAKCVNILENGNDIKLLKKARKRHIALPTTAGTGSESTSFAVVYKDGIKLSVEHKSILPEIAILDPRYLKTLNQYTKKSALMDALCQAIESYWSNQATETSRAYAIAAMNGIVKCHEDFLSGNSNAELKALHFANLSGRAINISKTTAPHAMSYKLSSMFGISHGHAVALCMIPVIERLIQKIPVLDNIGLSKKFKLVFENTGLPKRLTEEISEAQLLELVSVVDSKRQKNHPVALSEDELRQMYESLFENIQ